MFNQYYKFDSLGNKSTLLINPTNKHLYRFKAKYRDYHVIIEFYDFNFAAMKYCDRKDIKSPKTAYNKIFNDGDAFKVISTCVHIMFEVWRTHKNMSFVFYAVPRDNIPEKRLLNKEYVEDYKRTRFNIYKYAMLNMFPPKNFNQVDDYHNCIYVLLNKANVNKEKSLKTLGEFILSNHDIIFEPQ